MNAVRVLFVSVGSAALLGSCSLLFPLEETADTPVDASTVSKGDVGTSEVDASRDGGMVPMGPDGGDAGVIPADAGIDLIYNGSMEIEACALSWDRTNAQPLQTLTGAEVAPHGGTQSCRICSLSSASSFGLRGKIARAISLDAGRYRFSAWVRSDPEVDASAQVRLRVYVEPPDGGSPISAPFFTIPPLTDTSAVWVELLEELNLSSDAGPFMPGVSATATDAGTICFLVDDIRIVPLP